MWLVLIKNWVFVNNRLFVKINHTIPKNQTLTDFKVNFFKITLKTIF